MMTPYEHRRDRERRDPQDEHGPGHETCQEKQDRWREDWRREDQMEQEQEPDNWRNE